MPAVPDVRPTSVSTTGFADGLGRRSIRFDRESGTTLECLHVRPELAVFDSALRRQAALIEELANERVVRVHSFEVIAGRLTVTSELPAGDRLADIMDARACADSAVSGIDTAFGFLLQVLPTLSSMHAANVVHGAVAPHRIILTTQAQVVLTDAIYGTALPRLNLSHRRAWTEFGIAFPSASAARVDGAADVSQAVFSALLLALGRPLTALDPATSLHEMVREAVEIAQIRGGDSLAERVRTLFSAALGIPAREHRVTADRAIADVRLIVESQLGEDTCLAALAEFSRYDAPEVTIVRARPVLVATPLRETSEVLPPAAPAATVSAAPPAEVGAFDFWSKPVEQVVDLLDDEDAADAAALDEMFETEAATAASAVVAPAPAVQTELPAALREAFVQPSLTDRSPAVPAIETTPLPKAVAVYPEPEPASEVTTAPEPEVTTEPEPIRAITVAPAAIFRPVPLPVHLPAPPVPNPVAIPAPVQQAQSSPALRIKEEPPTGYVPPRMTRTFDAEAEPEPARRLPWKIVAAAVVVLTVGGLAVRAAWRPDSAGASQALSEAAGPAATPEVNDSKPAPGTGVLAVNSQPLGARVLLDGTDSGKTPLRLESVTAGRHTITLVTDTATVKRGIRITAGQTTTLDIPVFSGWVAVFAPIVLEVSEGGRSLGTTEQSRIMLAPGRHTITLSHREYGYSSVETVDIVGGEEKTLNITPMGTVNLNAQPWAEVWIDGAKAGETPLANLPVALGTRVFLFKHPQFGERRLTETITSKPSALSVDLTKPPSHP